MALINSGIMYRDNIPNEKKRIEDDYYKEYMSGVGDIRETGQEMSGNILEREMAKLRMRLGYNQYAGAGTGGWWNLARGGMETAGMQKMLENQQKWDLWEAEQRANWARTEDAQAHALQMQRLQAQYQMQMLERQAELNDPTWWETFGSIVGMSALFLPGIGQLLGLPTNSLTDVFKAIKFQF